MRKICIINQKGGVGKTTTSVNIGAGLSRLNKKVLILDLDPQAHIGTCLAPASHTNKDIYSLIVESADIKECIKPLGKNLDIISGSADLLEAEKWMLTQKAKESLLKKKLQSLTGYDYILIDCPPSLGILTVNALVASRYVLIPVQCEYYALEGLSQLLGTLELVRHNLQPNLDVLGAVLTMREKRTRLSRGVVKEMTKNFPGRVFETIIPRNVRLSEAPSFGKTILEYDHRSQGGKAYKRLAQELLAVLEE